MQWLGWLRDRLAGNNNVCLPAMLRVRDAEGRVVPSVDLLGTWEPGGQRFQKTQVTASGLCMLEWPAQARRMWLEVRSSDQSANLEIASLRDDPERVIEVRLS